MEAGKRGLPSIADSGFDRSTRGRARSYITAQFSLQQVRYGAERSRFTWGLLVSKRHFLDLGYRVRLSFH